MPDASRPDIDPERMQRDLAVVEKAARAAVRAETGPVAEAAVEHTTAAYLQHVLTGGVIEHPAGWGDVVARRFAEEQRRRPITRSLECAGVTKQAAGPAAAAQHGGIELDAWLRRHGWILTESQRRTVRAVRRTGSFHAAARALGRDRSSVRRSFASAMRRLQRLAAPPGEG